MRLPFLVAPEGAAFQSNINEIFKELLKVIGIADDILILDYDDDGKTTTEH